MEKLLHGQRQMKDKGRTREGQGECAVKSAIDIAGGNPVW